jgi:hypothetical protein
MNKQELIHTLRGQLQEAKQEREAAKVNPAMGASRTALKEYQAKRLRETHKDLLNGYATRGAAEFFLKEIYGSKDLSQRDKDVEKLIPMMETAFPLNTLETITQAIVLDALSEKLDMAMANELGPVFTDEQYIEAFKKVASKEEREKQINLVESLGMSLCQLVRIPLLSTTLKMMRFPAKIAGIYSLHEFLENGFNVFKDTGNPEFFIKTLVSKEREILQNIYQSHTEPFKLKM